MSEDVHLVVDHEHYVVLKGEGAELDFLKDVLVLVEDLHAARP